MTDNGKRYAIIVGISSYGDARQNDLRFSRNDAEEMYSVLLDSAGFTADNTALFCDMPSDRCAPIARTPSRSDILSYIQSVTSKVTDEDVILFYFAGHGTEISDRPYLITNDTRMNVVKSTALDVMEINDHFSNSKARTVIRFFDACRSNFAETRHTTEPMSKGFADALFARSKGWLTFSACSSGELAYEHPDLDHGVFTYYLCEGIRGAAKNENGQITSDRLIDYVKQSVSNWCKQQGFLQTPHVVTDLSGTLVIASARSEQITPAHAQGIDWLAAFKTTLSSTLSAAPLDIRNLAFTNKHEFDAAAELLFECIQEQALKFDIPHYDMAIKELMPLHNHDSDAWNTFVRQIQEVHLNKEFTNDNSSTAIVLRSAEVLLPNISASISLMRFKFFYWIWYSYRCEDKGMRDNWKAEPQFKRGYFTFKPSAVNSRDKLEIQVDEIFSSMANDIVAWTRQLQEYLDVRIQPLRDSGKIIS